MKWVFFDFNGTIIDDVDLCLNLLNEILLKQGNKTVSKEEYKDIFCFPVRKYYELAGVDLKKDSFDDLSKWFIKKYQPASYECNLFPHLKETILELKKRGIKVAVLSASQIDNLKDQLIKFKIIDLFDAVLGLDDIHAASKVEVGKSFILANKIKPQDILFVGDTNHDKEVADAIGAKAILFSEGHQSLKVLGKENTPIINDLRKTLLYV